MIHSRLHPRVEADKTVRQRHIAIDQARNAIRDAEQTALAPIGNGPNLNEGRFFASLDAILGLPKLRRKLRELGDGE